jgi:23S rRNA pseudouridine1911/1915/1917 synthase
VKSAAVASGSLLNALQELVPGASKRTLRQMLSQGRISVNGIPCPFPNHPIAPGDMLEIGPRRTPKNLPHGLDILYEDVDILVVRKPVGLLTVATADERERTVFAYLRQYLRDRNPKQKLYIVHRLDKFASGILVFARSEKVQTLLRDVFRRHEIRRKYWAIVEGTVEKDRGTIRSYLAQDRSLRMHSTKDPEQGKLAITHFRVLRRLKNMTALEVTLETGRKNQIRVHLSEMGCPIAGDRAYGSAQNPLGRLGLHAFHLGFNHPVTGDPLTFQTVPPPEFAKYLPDASREDAKNAKGAKTIPRSSCSSRFRVKSSAKKEPRSR